MKKRVKIIPLLSKTKSHLSSQTIDYLVWFMVFNATFNNISVISWQSVLLVLATRLPGENHRPVTSH
jgi:hypothetical protein